MSYHIKQSELSYEGLQRVARDQIAAALEELQDDQLGLQETVHQVRKRCKKLRGLVRLFRPQFEAIYQQENARYRDASRRLAPVRDAEARIETLDALQQHFAAITDANQIAAVRIRLVERRDAIAGEVNVRRKLEQCKKALEEGRRRVDDWRLDDDDFSTVHGGLKKTYGRARKAMDRAYAKPRPENFHEWRKRTKYHWYHLRLLSHSWQDVLSTRADAAHRLSDLLGDDHDLAVLATALCEHGSDLADSITRRALLALIQRRRQDLQAHARPLGRRLYCEKPGRFVGRLRNYWNAWRGDQAG